MKRVIKYIAVVIAIIAAAAGGGITALYLVFKTETSGTNKDLGVINNTHNQLSGLVQDPMLLKEANELGLDVTNVSLVYDSTITLTDSETYGFFSGPNTIEISPASPHQRRTLAHEYLHYIVSNMSQTEFSDVSRLVMNIYESDSSLRNRMQPYIQRGDTPGTTALSNELFAILCTESSDKYLSNELLAYCNKYLNRSKISNLFAR